MRSLRRNTLVAFSLALALAGCPRQVTRDDGGHAASDAGHNSFDGPITLDDERVSHVDPSTLPAGAAPCMAPVLARVYHIADGDTISVRSDNPVLDARVRFIGVNAPEIAHPPAPAECYGDEASAFTSQLEGHLVWLTFDSTCHDPYDRLLAYVHVGDGEADFWQRQMLRRGFARVLTVGDDRTYAPVFESDETYANMAGAGLWTACF